MTSLNFIYNKIEYTFEYNALDVSEIWCIDEIVTY